MLAIVAVVSVLSIVIVLVDAFEAMLLPRRVSRQFRLIRLYYIYTWPIWAGVACRMRPGKRRNAFLSYYGPLSMLLLFVFWAVGLIFGFALLQWALGTEMKGAEAGPDLGVSLYFSGVTFFTLGFGDITPAHSLGRFIAVVEAGIGFGFLAVVISYLPVVYQAFSRRELAISLLDARGGSPPTAAEVLVRQARYNDLGRLERLLEEWEKWAAETLESHISFPVLSFYRSQHDNQSWLATLTVVLDVSAIIVAGVQNSGRSQAWLTFAMSRHTAVDLCQALRAAPIAPSQDRLAADRLMELRTRLASHGLPMADGPAVDRRLVELRGMYEPFVNALSEMFLLDLPRIVGEPDPVDNWQTSAWMRRVKGARELAAVDSKDDHDD